LVPSADAKTVIPESAGGGYPESRNNNALLDTGSRPPPADSSGMTLQSVSMFSHMEMMTQGILA
jgi:hypothetical protein